ncbi:hypothetical protein FSP39_022801 [Pinctada imbricata]|uniref:Uncharacterized protein n=1 Tax=Pinctada imbricata TaxID=66713 RepID=A0AA89C2D7_PINIB|nr:hypothetical protein FSP39_022801 [Pinctada imbricata]
MYCSTRILTLTSFVLGAISVGTLSLSVATDSWLFMVDPITKKMDNETRTIQVTTNSGLWKVCTIFGTATVKGNNRMSVFFPVASLMFMVMATILAIIGNIREDVKTLLAAVAYISGALLLAIGIILYISAINDEVGHRMKTSDSKEAGPMNSFRYWYGWSFFFAGTAFITSMLTAVVLVTLYLKRNNKQEDMIKIIPGLEDVIDSDCNNDDGNTNPTVIL